VTFEQKRCEAFDGLLNIALLFVEAVIFSRIIGQSETKKKEFLEEEWSIYI